MQAFVILGVGGCVCVEGGQGGFGALFFLGRGNWSVACACVGCELTWVWGAMNAKWQGLISFAEVLP